MLLLFNAYTEHKANSTPAEWGDKFLSTEMEVRFGNKSESNLFLENQKILIHFCMKQCEDMLWYFFWNKKTRQIGWPDREMDAILSSSVQYFKQLTDGGVMLSHQNYVATYSWDKHKEAMQIHHFVILQLFHVKFKKIGNIIFFHDNHTLFVCHFNHNEEQEYTNIFEDMPSFEFLWLGEQI